MISYREVLAEEITKEWLDDFDRKEIVDQYWYYRDNQLVLSDVSTHVSDWDQEERYHRSLAMKDLLMHRPSRLYGAFDQKLLVGFALIGYELFGSHQQYVQLHKMHVAQGYRGLGIGKRLFTLCKEQALTTTASKLYVSGNPAVRAQAFYQHLGASLAKEIHKPTQVEYPLDIPLEIILR